MPAGRPSPPARPVERVGWALFGSWKRLQLGMWIAGLPGLNQPRTFTIQEFEEHMKSRDLPWGYPVRADLRRFVYLEMLQERPEMTTKRYCQHWTRLDSPLWNIYMMAGMVLSEHEGWLAEQRRLTVNDLSRLREELLQSQVVELERDEEERWAWTDWM